MNRIMFFLLFLTTLCPLTIRAQRYTIIEKGSRVNFSIMYHKDDGQMVRGKLTRFKGTIAFDPRHLAAAAFDVTINTNTAATGIKAADDDLKKDMYFNTAKYPVIQIRSKSVTVDEPGSTIYTLHGDLTIKGITHPVNVQFMALPSGNGYMLRGSFHLSRIAYSLGKPGGDLDDNVDLFIELKVEK